MVALGHASTGRAEGEETMVLMAHRGAKFVAASPKSAVLKAEGTKRAFTGVADTLTLHDLPWPVE